ncbi:MAG: TonB family protein [Sulfurimonas sp.]|uniref:energy transducer TonB n=1 Tax=Sulfurimonas sp. TaxID=2022749 RepID=UPI0028CCB9B8|nr:TonB family protein [Sulfurimonas sp.]MDT8339267.1 TonB family protein [Sulfurimonas sp.]
MIRHSSSFFISVVVHLTLLFGAYFAWSSYIETKEECLEESLCLQLRNVKNEQKKVEPKKEQKKIEQPKKEIEKKVEKKVEQLPKPKPPKKEIVVEKSLPKVQEIQKSEVVKEEIIEEKSIIAEQVEIEQIVATAQKKVPEEPKEQKAEPKQIKKVDETQEYLKVNTQMISALIRDNLYYPMAARKRNITGRVSVKFTLCPDGKVDDIKIIDSSSDILSRAALKTIEELSGKFPKPRTNIILTLPIDYSLN